MADYAGLASTALRLIEANGRSITVKRTSGTHVPATGGYTPTATTSGTLKAVVLPASKGTIEAFDNRVVDGTLIDEKLRYVLAAAKGAPFEPKSNDLLEFDSLTWRILGCTPLNPAGTPLVYKIGCIRV